tara:strand:- start:233 stop:1597 length:1365 start_codon:yes stop_codon:yes gene_type:complete
MARSETYKLAMNLAFQAQNPRSAFKMFFDAFDGNMIRKAIRDAQILLDDDVAAKTKLLEYARKHLPEIEGKEIKTKHMATRQSKTDAIDNLEANTDGRSKSVTTLINLEMEIEVTTEKMAHVLVDHDKDQHLKPIQQAHLGRIISGLKHHICSIKNLMTRHDYLSRARTDIRKHFDGLPEPLKQAVFDRTKALHDAVATRYKAEYQKTNRANRNDPELRNKGQTLSWNTAQEFINEAENIIIEQIAKPKSWGKLANALSLVSGRRMYEVCLLGQFQVVDNHRLTMAGLAKQKNEDDFVSRTLEFPCLINANLFKQGIETLRAKKDFTRFEDYNDFRKKCSNAMAKVLKVGDTSVTIFEINAVTTALTPKMMRQIYAAISLYKIKKQYLAQSDVYYAKELAKILGHSVREYGGRVVQDDIHTVMSYMDWTVVDELPPKTLSPNQGLAEDQGELKV